MFCIYSVGNAMSNQMEEFMIMDMAGGYTEDGVIVLLQVLHGRFPFAVCVHRNMYIIRIQDSSSVGEGKGQALGALSVLVIFIVPDDPDSRICHLRRGTGPDSEAGSPGTGFILFVTVINCIYVVGPGRKPWKF